MTLAPAVEARIDEAGRQTPQWRPWLDLVVAALREDGARGWDAVRIEEFAPHRDDAALLDGATLVVPAGLLEDRGELLVHAVAQTAGADADLAALPLLRACGRRLAARVPANWSRGWCPICGAWPTLVESRGLERSRRLRCTRCAADWSIAWLVCVFCGESDHERLTALVPQPEGGRRVDACRSCSGYVKTCSTLVPLTPEELPIEDLATVDLDVVAIERGFERPPRSAHAAVVRLATLA